MLDGTLAFFKKHFYDEFEAVWSWRVPTGKRQESNYNQILLACRTSQYILAGVALIISLSFEYSRQLFLNVASREGIYLLILEFFPLMILGYCLGMKRIPPNYIALTIMQFFILLEKQMKPQVKDFQLKVLGESRSQGQWSVLTYSSSSERVVIPVETKLRDAGLLITSLLAFWVTTKFTDIDFSKYERTALLSTTAGTASAALLLVSSFAFQTFPEFKAVHRRYCEYWMILGVTVYVFLLLFLFQRLRKSVNGKMKANQNMRLIWECAIYTMALYIMVCYVPVIHKGLSTRDLLQHKTVRVGEAITPRPVSQLVRIVAAYFYSVGEAVAKMHAGLMKNY